MAMYIYWFLLAVALLGVEMVTGTFYLLMISIAMAIGGFAALSGLGFPAQLSLAALAGVAGIVFLRRKKSVLASDADNQNLDAGQAVKILSWRDDGTARVFYRGADWDAELDVPDSPREGVFYIKSMRGSVIILAHRKPGVL